MVMMSSESKPGKKHSCEDLSEWSQWQWNGQRQLFPSSPLSSQGQYKDDSTTLATITPSAELKPSLRDKTAGSLDNLESEKQKQMLHQLQECHIDRAVSLPQLVVCGDQSSGKSSVLEAITRVPFPRNDNVCTRFETEIRLRGDSMKEFLDGSRVPTEEKKTDSFEESELSADWSHYPWHNKDLGDFGPGGNKTKKYITRSTFPTEKLDPRFKLDRSKEFMAGRVFKVLWSEPAGTQESSKTLLSIHEGKIYSPIRRFVIVATGNGHCTCLPILTYDGRGTRKQRLHSADHSMIYTSNRSNEQRSLLSKDIHKATLVTTNKLDPISRLNYAKVYTVEHNAKVWFIEKVDGKSIDHDPDLNHGMYMNHGKPTGSDRESSSTPNILTIDSRLHEDDTSRTSDRLGDQDIAHDVAIEVMESWKFVEEDGELFLILDDETCDCDNGKYSHFQRLTRVTTSPKALAGLGISSGLLMGASFLWLNKRMELNHTSPIMGWFAETAKRNFSATTRDALGLIPDGVIFTVFVFATAILTGSSFAWMTNNTQNPGAKSLGWAVAVMISVSWLFAAVTIEEFLLVCLPLSVGFGILSSCWFDYIDVEDVGVEKFVCEV